VSAEPSEDNLHHNNYVVTAGNTLDSGWAYAFTGFAAQGDYSSGRYQAITGDSVELKGNSDVRPLFFNFGLNKDAWDMRVMYERYLREDYLGFGGLGLFINDLDNPDTAFTPFSAAGKNFFTSLSARVAYRWQAGERLRITPALMYSQVGCVRRVFLRRNAL